MKLSEEKWWREATQKPKLRNYIEVRSPEDEFWLPRLGLRRQEGSLLAKLLCGVLPLEIENGRYVGKAIADRLCKVCNTNCVEDEFHFLFYCCMYQGERSGYYVGSVSDIEYFMLLSDPDKVKYMLEKKHVKDTGAYVTIIYQKRRQKSCINVNEISSKNILLN